MSAAVCCWAALWGSAKAQETAFEVPLASSAYVKDFAAFKLAAADAAEVPANRSYGASPDANKAESKPSWLTGGKVHQYLGLSTIVAAALTAATHPEECESNCSPQTPRQTNGTHARLAKATVALAAATIVTGILVHWDDIQLSDGITDPDNLHALLGISGAALMAYAVNKSKNSAVPVSHAGIAELGALGMVAAIKITW